MKRLMVHYDGQVREADVSMLDQWRRGEADADWIWLDLHEEDPETESNLLQDIFGVDEIEIIEAQRSRYPPAINLHDDYAFILMKPLDSSSHDLDFGTLQLAMFFSERFIVTRRSRVSMYLDQLWSALLDGSRVMNDPLDVLAAISRRITDRYAGVLLNLENRLDVIEDELFETAGEEMMRELVGYNTSLRKMRRIIAYHQNVFQMLTGDRRIAGEHERAEEFADISSLMTRNTSLADLYQSVITDLVEGYISLNGHHLNQIMKVLTVVTVVFVPITFLAGIYGMNFENMPELSSVNGYYILLSVMAAVVAVLLYVFRRMRWL